MGALTGFLTAEMANFIYFAKDLGFMLEGGGEGLEGTGINSNRFLTLLGFQKVA